MPSTWVRDKYRQIIGQMREDIAAALANDPAARTALEVSILYPGLHAVWIYRIAHALWSRGYLWAGRWVSHIGRLLTGVEIHPGATIGRRLFIDHGMGVVIGETARIGDDAILYQGVVLGGTRRERTKRHPTVGNGVVIGAGAILLGPITIGDHARIGAGSVVIRSVPEETTVVGVPAKVARLSEGTCSETALEHGRLVDPLWGALQELADHNLHLEERLERLEAAMQDHVTSRPMTLGQEQGNEQPAACKELTLQRTIDATP